ncbi:MAG: agmatine deiminase family protein, partial [Phenylobacterium sp.]|nr:agmatine deiminase family protein [Phenylobacterium sp.]
MTTDEVLEEFRGAGALREGHFVLSSGLHSAVFLQKNLVFQYPDRTERLCKALAELILREVGEVDVCVSPAVGGIIPGYETARQLGAMTGVRGAPLQVMRIPSPGWMDGDGGPAPASHMNFIIANRAVIVPLYEDEKAGAFAVDAVQSLFPERKV